MVLACDGIWDCLSSQQVIDFVRRAVANGDDMGKICEDLMVKCLATDSETGGIGCDNMTVVIVALLNGRTTEEWQAWVKERVDNKGESRLMSMAYVLMCQSAVTPPSLSPTFSVSRSRLLAVALAAVVVASVLLVLEVWRTSSTFSVLQVSASRLRTTMRTASSTSSIPPPHRVSP